MPHELDQRIRVSFEQKSLRGRLQDALGLKSIVWPATAFGVFAAFYFIAGHSDLYRGAEAWAAVVDREIRRQISAREGIVYEKTIIEEGRDKSLVVALKNDIAPDVTAQVAKRADTVEVWSHNITSLVKAEKNIDHVPAYVTLNLENEDHLHLFASASSTCETLQMSQACAMQALTDEGVAHRKLFDEVHDIRSNYDRQENPQVIKEYESLPTMRLVSSDERLLVFRHQTEDGVRMDYYFDAQTFDRQKEVTSIALNGMWYEMAIKKYIDYQVVPTTEFATIFDVEAYTLEQRDVIPLSAPTSI